MMVKESQVIIATLSQLVAAKMEELISHVKVLVNGRIAIVVARFYSLVLCGYQVPSPLRTWEPYWELFWGLDLAQ